MTKARSLYMPQFCKCLFYQLEKKENSISDKTTTKQRSNKELDEEIDTLNFKNEDKMYY